MATNGKRASRKFLVALIVILLAFVVVGYGMKEIAEGGKEAADAEHIASVVEKALEIVMYMGLGYVAGNVLEKFSGWKKLLPGSGSSSE